MTFKEKIINFLKKLILSLQKSNKPSLGTRKLLQGKVNSKPTAVVEAEGYISNSEQDEKSSEESIDVSIQKYKVNLSRRTLITKLYMLEQEIEVFKQEYINDYNTFLSKIENLRIKYRSLLEDVQNNVMFTIDPELSGNLQMDIAELESEIAKFIETEVKHGQILKRVQKLIVKLSILYNVSIFHPDEKFKVISQLERAMTLANELAQEFKDCRYILKDSRRKDRVVTLLSYVDYLTLKIALRNSSLEPTKVFERLVLHESFINFDYISSFKAFIEDELSDLQELFPNINDKDVKKYFDEQVLNLFNELVYSSSVKEKLSDKTYWQKVFSFEATLLEYLKNSSDMKVEEIKVPIIRRMNICINESEVLTLPITNTRLALVSLFAATHDDRVWLLLKFLKNISSEVTYKEIYFLVLLFDVLELLKNTPNTLFKYIEKYIDKFNYDSESIRKKKMHLLNHTNNNQYVNYIKVFSFDEDFDKIVGTLSMLGFDFNVKKIQKDSLSSGNSINVEYEIYLNEFYFKGLEKLFDTVTKSENDGGAV